jgi:hypothetical protein
MKSRRLEIYIKFCDFLPSAAFEQIFRNLRKMILKSSVADMDPEGYEPFYSDPDPNVRNRIRILGHIHLDTFLTFLV